MQEGSGLAANHLLSRIQVETAVFMVSEGPTKAHISLLGRYELFFLFFVFFFFLNQSSHFIIVFFSSTTNLRTLNFPHVLFPLPVQHCVLCSEWGGAGGLGTLGMLWGRGLPH